MDVLVDISVEFRSSTGYQGMWRDKASPSIEILCKVKATRFVPMHCEWCCVILHACNFQSWWQSEDQWKWNRFVHQPDGSWLRHFLRGGVTILHTLCSVLSSWVWQPHHVVKHKSPLRGSSWIALLKFLYTMALSRLTGQHVMLHSSATLLLSYFGSSCPS